MSQRRGVSWWTKLFVLLLSFSVLPAAGLTYLTVSVQQDAFRRATLDGLSALAAAKAEAIDQFTEYRHRDVERIASLVADDLDAVQTAESALLSKAQEPPVEQLPKLEDAEDIDGTATDAEKAPEPENEPPQAPDTEGPPTPSPEEKAVEEARARLRRTLGLILWDQQEFEELLVIGPRGRVIASTFDQHEGRSAAGIDYFKGGLKASYVQPVFVSPITEQLTMVLSTPIRDSKEKKVVGVVAARLNLKRFFQLINDTTGLGTTGETVVAKKIDDQVVFMAPTRHADDAALSQKVELGAAFAVPLQDAARGNSGSGVELDYRSQRVFAAWQHIPSLEWGLVSKIDYDEAMRWSQQALERTLIVGLIVLLLVVAASHLMARALVRPLRELKEATDKISRGNFDVQIDIRSKDEIGELADSFERMVAAIKFFREKSLRGDADEELEDPESTESPPSKE